MSEQTINNIKNEDLYQGDTEHLIESCSEENYSEHEGL
jgi:hypothetical protein